MVRVQMSYSLVESATCTAFCDYAFHTCNTLNMSDDWNGLGEFCLPARCNAFVSCDCASHIFDTYENAKWSWIRRTELTCKMHCILLLGVKHLKHAGMGRSMHQPGSCLEVPPAQCCMELRCARLCIR